MPRHFRPLERRVLWIAALAMALGSLVALVARALTGLIGLVTNLAFYGRLSTEFSSPAYNHLGLWVIGVPVLGGLIVGAMARWGSRAIRGHGIPEAMEQVLLNESRIPPRITWLKPVSSAIAIGTGGPFGAEGPIIATGGALGSLLGQLLHVTADERKTLLAAGAAAGMAAVFSAPISSVLLALELLLFERRARSLIPVALAASVGTGVRYLLEGNAPMFPMPDIATPTFSALAAYMAMGVIAGAASVGITKLTYAIEDGFEKLPIHWMWWPAIGGVAVGVVGYFMPATLGVGYTNIAAVIGGQIGLAGMLALCLMKLLSWSIALGSGTSGGTLAPLFTIGGAMGGVLGLVCVAWLPWLQVDARVAALVCMAAIFAGASRAFLTSVVFAFETTQQPHGLVPLLGACAMAYLVSGLLMRNTIMTEKIARRGVLVPSEYAADHLERITVGEACSRQVVSLHATQPLSEVRAWLTTQQAAAKHQGFPVLGDDDRLLGVVTRRDLFDASTPDDATVHSLLRRAPLVVREDHSLREAADHMVEADVGRLVVVSGSDGQQVVGIVTRGDLLAAHARRLREAREAGRHLWPKAKQPVAS
ncbi:CBS domain-containing protein [Dyella solisilvae]|uniref:CBS domain-containing protein n=1 Tax=Dyella solisilvae TaxID=1920168 RepID=A0A370K3A2_9GAMM|nr:chloride channel protein [Dyella solisilvae]RDI97146.1 CBS domain-containing protein [Dyella solisilvae]